MKTLPVNPPVIYDARDHGPEVTHLRARLQAILKDWRQTAQRAWSDAQAEPDPMGKRLIEHGAMCYGNCVTELEALLQEIAGFPPVSKIQGSPAGSTPPQA